MKKKLSRRLNLEKNDGKRMQTNGKPLSLFFIIKKEKMNSEWKMSSTATECKEGMKKGKSYKLQTTAAVFM